MKAWALSIWPLMGNKLVKTKDGNDNAEVDTSHLNYVYRFDLTSFTSNQEASTFYRRLVQVFD